MQNKIILFSIIIFFLFGSFFVSLSEKRQQDISRQNIWMLYFEKPTASPMDFTIENHSTSENFHWEIFLDKNMVRGGDSQIKKETSKTIPVTITDIANRKITIVVDDGKQKKEIYKIF